MAEGAPGDVALPVEDYAYDEEGNRTASHLSALYASNAHNQLLEDEDYIYAYDERGNRVSRTTKADGAVETYTYDSQNRLVGYLSPTTTASYTYDGLDRRIAKAVDGLTEAYVYDFSDVTLDFDDAGLAKRWLHGSRVDEPLSYERYAGTTIAGSGSGVALYADRLGSILEEIDQANGQFLSESTYDSFGSREVAGAATRYGFTAREHDDESGLMYFRARHYDPVLGQFIQRDPIGFAAGDFNLYAYVKNDPHNWTDPSGLASSSVENTVLSAVGLGVVCYASGACSAASKAIEDLAGLTPGGSSPGGSNSSPNGDGGALAPVVDGLKGPLQGILDSFIWESRKPDSNPPPAPPPTTEPTTTSPPPPPEGGGFDDDPRNRVKKIVKDQNSADDAGYQHTINQGVNRNIWSSRSAAETELRTLISNVKRNGFPNGTIRDTARADQVLVPVGNNGYAVLRVAANGTARFRSALNRF